MKKIVLFFICLFSIGSSFSQLLLTENFAYTTTGTTANDTLTNAAIGGSLWKRHSGAGTPIVWSATGLTYTGYGGSGIGGAVSYTNGAGSREDANIALSDSIKSGNVYLSFLVNVTASGGTVGDYNVHFSAIAGATASSFSGRIFIKDGSAANTFKFGLSKGSAAAAAVFTTADYNYNQTYLVVLKYAFNSATTTDDVVSAYFLTSGVPVTEPAVADLTATDMTVNDLAKVYGVCIRQGTVGTAAAILDGFRVARSWDDAPLPVKLNSFSAVGLRNTVNVNWSILTSDNNTKFSVERSSNGTSFEEIATLNATTKTSYTVSDKNLPNANSLYYRLKITDATGRFEYSAIQKIQLSNIKFAVSPNPATHTILINATSNIDNVTIYNLNGKVVYATQNIATNSLRIPVTNFTNGTYIVKTIVDGETATNKILIKH